MVKKLRRSAPRPRISQAKRQFQAWSLPLETIGHQLTASRDRFTAASGDPALFNETRGVRLLAECQRWRSLAAAVQRLSPPPMAQPAHDQTVAGFTHLADWGERLAAVTASNDETRITATLDEMPAVWAEVDQLLGEAITLAKTAALRLAGQGD